MASFITNRGAHLINMAAFRNSVATNFYLALCTAANTPTIDTNTLSELVEIAAGNGYTSGGISLSRNTTDFPTNTEDDTNDRATVTIKALTWTASGGPIPASGSVPAWAVLTTDEGTIGNRQIIAAFDLGTVSPAGDGQQLVLGGTTQFALRLTNIGGITNRGKYALLRMVFQAQDVPTQFYLALSTTAPTADTNTLSDLTEAAAGNGYTAGGIAVTRDATGFPTMTEDDSGNLAIATLKNVAFTASGGSLPGSGSGARYPVLLTDEGTVGNRRVIAYYDLGAAYYVTDGNAINCNGYKVRLVQ